MCSNRLVFFQRDEEELIDQPAGSTKLLVPVAWNYKAVDAVLRKVSVDAKHVVLDDPEHWRAATGIGVDEIADVDIAGTDGAVKRRADLLETGERLQPIDGCLLRLNIRLRDLDAGIGGVNRRLQLGLGALSSFAVGMFSSRSATPLATIMAVSSVIALVVLLAGRRAVGKLVELSGGGVAGVH